MKVKNILFLLIILLTILLIPNIVNAAEATDTSGIIWIYDLQNEQATKLIPKNKDLLPAELIIPAELDGYPVTSIGERAFYKCNNLINITIPNTVTTIEDGAFQICEGLKNIKMPEGITAIGAFMFDQCNLLEEINIPNSLQKIEKYAFYGCKKLNNITLPNTLTEIEEYAFYECESISTIIIPDSVKIIGGRAFYNCNGVKIYYIQNTLTNVLNNDDYNYIISDSKDYKTELIPNEGYKLPKSITAKINNIDLSNDEYTYNSTNGELTIPASLINGDITIEAIGQEVYQVIFNANDGKFGNENSVLKYDDADNCDFNNIEIPVRTGYKFIGYYTEKTEGISFDDVMNSEAGIEDDITFYAHWEKIEEPKKEADEEEKQENVTKKEPSKELDESPLMGNDVQNLKLNIVLVIISFSIFTGLKIYNKENN